MDDNNQISQRNKNFSCWSSFLKLGYFYQKSTNHELFVKFTEFNIFFFLGNWKLKFKKKQVSFLFPCVHLANCKCQLAMFLSSLFFQRKYFLAPCLKLFCGIFVVCRYKRRGSQIRVFIAVFFQYIDFFRLVRKTVTVDFPGFAKNRKAPFWQYLVNRVLGGNFWYEEPSKTPVPGFSGHILISAENRGKLLMCPVMLVSWAVLRLLFSLRAASCSS